VLTDTNFKKLVPIRRCDFWKKRRTHLIYDATIATSHLREGDKGAKSAEKSRKARFSLRKEHVLMSSDEDVPAPSPSASVLARRASREAKSMREESSSEEDSDELVEWQDDDEVSSEEDGSEKCQRRRLSRAPATPPV
jgi:hypothetical protein